MAYIYLHLDILDDFPEKCWQIYHEWILWIPYEFKKPIKSVVSFLRTNTSTPLRCILKGLKVESSGCFPARQKKRKGAVHVLRL